MDPIAGPETVEVEVEDRRSRRPLESKTFEVEDRCKNGAGVEDRRSRRPLESKTFEVEDHCTNCAKGKQGNLELSTNARECNSPDYTAAKDE
jgi:hypothetical protein